MAAGRIPPRAVVVTFDDGYADNLLNMLPIAEEVGVPVTIFVSTGLLGTDREFWWDELERLFLTGRRLPPRLRLPWGEETLDWPTDSSASIRKAYDGMHTLIKALIPEERESRLSALRAWAGANAAGRPSHRSLTHEELVSLARSPLVTIGAHTRSHTALSALSPERQRDEISGSKRELEALLSSEVPIFSYPFGEKRDYTRITPGLCREAGFQAAYSNFYGQIFAPTDRFQIPRALVRNWSVEEFAKRMRGFFRA
jgi:peptidoglycan/xylan/chitin deacetylase (PgdA/CDA1 family)